MSLFSKKEDLMARREKALHADLARLEKEVLRLATESPKPAPVVRTGETDGPAGKPFARPLPPMSAPTASGALPPGHFNDRGLRKFDVIAFWNGIKNHLSGPTGNNPAMVRMLAAGSLHGLRPLRRERRVARNRFIFLFLTLLAILWGLAFSYFRQH